MVVLPYRQDGLFFSYTYTYKIRMYVVSIDSVWLYTSSDEVDVAVYRSVARLCLEYGIIMEWRWLKNKLLLLQNERDLAIHWTQLFQALVDVKRKSFCYNENTFVIVQPVVCNFLETSLPENSARIWVWLVTLSTPALFLHSSSEKRIKYRWGGGRYYWQLWERYTIFG